ncbi:PPOX class F420-dependent oxidoreductase [Nocardia farcinica]|uniref:PPOX class F420-dependent oxidoreductase n=1 Tax=Nocardia farcinica TaxID=37329 RepID=UPI003980BEAA
MQQAGVLVIAQGRGGHARTLRYAQLRSYRSDGTPVDTPIWFRCDDTAVVFRTKRGPETRRLTADPRVALRPCDHRGRVLPGAPVLTGRAREDALRERYGWQWNILPMVRIPGVVNVHRDLPLREKLRRARARTLWPDSAIVRIELD